MAVFVHGLRSKLLSHAFALGLFVVALISALDVLTGQDITMSHFYGLNVVFVAWSSNRRAALVLAAACAATGIVADHLLSEPYLRFGTSFETEAIPFWNGASRLVVYAAVAHVVSALRQTIRQRDQLITELEQAAASIRTLEGLLPMCAWCKKMRDDERDGAWVPMEAYIATHTDAQVTHGICPACSAKHFGVERSV